MSEQTVPADPGIEVRTYFVRGRNALVARAEFSDLYAGLYLHQMDIGVRLDPVYDLLLRDALACLTLHCASRPRQESIAWTVNFQTPLVNLFVAGDNRLGTVVGTAFTEDVREAPHGVFFSDTAAPDQPFRRSVAEFSGDDFLRAAEVFYARSEQRPGRLFRYGEEDLVLVSAQPDCDLAWLESVDEDVVRRLDCETELSLLEQRRYRFECGCNQDRILTMLLPHMRRSPDDLFEGEEVLRLHCPRCGARHAVTRESVEARLDATRE